MSLSAFRAWGETDALLAMALTDYEAMLCDGCGQPMHESMDPETEGQWVAPLPMRCHACTAVAHRVKDYSESEAPQALRFRAEKRPSRTQPAG